MEQTLEAACASRAIPGAVLMATDKSGKFNYKKSFGTCSLKEPRDNKPLTADTIMWIASCTKFMTSIAAMQCVERGLITLDEDVRPILHELKDIDILCGVKDGVLESRKNTVPITLRQLLTHTAGFAYEFLDPLIAQWRKEQPESQRLPPTTLQGRFLHPLVYEPGTGWFYGPSIDWVGVLIERITHSNSLEDYMKQNIWDPLGITDMAFFLSKRPDLRARVADMSIRPPGSSTAEHATDQPAFRPEMVDALGGQGIFASSEEFMKVLRALLLSMDPDPSEETASRPSLLRRSTVNLMFSPQLGEKSHARLHALLEIPAYNRVMGAMPTETRKDWGLAGLLLLDDLPGWRSKGTMWWGGAPNLSWWVDREAGLCGLYATQTMPTGDDTTVELQQAFEKAIYERYYAARNSGQFP